MKSYEAITEAAKYILNKIKIVPQIGIILGTGASDYQYSVTDAVEITFDEIPEFPKSHTENANYKFIFGKIQGKYVLLMCAHYYCYEGYSMEDVAFPVQIMKEIGIEKLILTNAAGTLSSEYNVGDIVVVSDHIKFVIDSPLIGKNDERIGTRFPDMTESYSTKFRELAMEVGYGMDMELKEGVYAYMTGPAYETPAEIRALSVLGADVVGMSTVPEVIAASHCGVEVLALSIVTNKAAGLSEEKLSHEEVLEISTRACSELKRLIDMIIQRINIKQN